MNEKVSLHDLISFLAEKAGISKKEAELFLKEYFGAISDELLQDGFVKIKGLGSFKLTQVDERESIDVNLGTRVIVPAHDKINYIPDVQLAREVNEPFSIFEPVELDESISEEESELTTAMILSTENDDDLEDDSEDAEEPEMLSEQELTDTRIEEEDEQEGEQEEKGPCEKKNKKIIVKVVWLILFILLSGGIVFYIQNGERFCNKSVFPVIDDNLEYECDSLQQKKSDVLPTDSFALPDTTDLQQDVIVSDSVPQSRDEENPVINPEQAGVTVSTTASIKKRKVVAGERLAQIALEEYGDRIFWVYLYEENRHILENPDKLLIGTEIIIPSASKYKIDKNDMESIQKANNLAEKYKK